MDALLNENKHTLLSFSQTNVNVLRRLSYLFERPLGCADFVCHPKWDANHGGESQQPANDVAPPWVHILIVVLERSVFDEGEGKGALQRQGNEYLQVVRW